MNECGRSISALEPVILALVIVATAACGQKKEQDTEPLRATKTQSSTVAFDQASTSFASFSSQSVRAAAMRYPAPEAATSDAPISLTADDGTGLALEILDARAVVEGPLAFTELHLTFRNPSARVLEGRFQVTLPEGASVSRLAMKTQAGWQEAEMVERQAARRAYEDFLHRKQDPMLLEKEAGNQFRARIFPIPANGTKEVILSYSHEISERVGYRLPLRGLPQIGKLRVHAMVAEPSGASSDYRSEELSLDGEVPTADFVVNEPSPLLALRQANHVVARIKPSLDVESSPLRGLTILFDTSASRAPGYARQVRRLGELVESLAARQGRELPLRVVAFDQEVAPLYMGTLGGFGDGALSALLARRPLGASNLGAALRWVGKEAALDRLLIISDAITTAGESELAGIAKELPAAIARIDALLVGGIRDQEAAGRMVRGTRANDGVVLSDSMANEEIAQRLGDATASLELTIAGAEWNWPRTVHGVQPGDEIVVYGAYGAEHRPSDTVEVTIQGAQDLSLKSVAVPGALLTRSVVQAQIARSQSELLEEKDESEKAKKQASVVAMSTKYRVLSDYTALLVLETDNDYRRFGIDRNALVDILAVHDGGLRIEQRQRIIPKATPVPSPPSRELAATDAPEEEEEMDADEESAGTGTRMAEAEGRMGRRDSSRTTGQYAMRNSPAEPQMERALEEARKAGVLGALSSVPGGRFDGAAGPGGGGSGNGTIRAEDFGTIGHGAGTGSGYGRGSLRPRGGPRTAPTVRIGESTVRGALDKNIIRRYIRRKMPRIKHCYERQLLVDPQLSGTVNVRFTINRNGAVSQARSQGLGNRNVENCVADAIKSIQFPKPAGGGTVVVSYPFAMAPPGAEPQSTTAAPVSPDEPQAWGGTDETQPVEQLRPTIDPTELARAAESQGPPALTGTMAEIRRLIEAKKGDEAVTKALAWRSEEPGNVMALVALGEALELIERHELAARAYGSIIDLFPSRADLRRFASARLISLGESGAGISVDSLKKAVEQRPDHLSGHRLLAYALLRSGDLEAAFAAVETGLQQNYPSGRFAGGLRILKEDLGIIGNAWIAKDSSKQKDIADRVSRAGSRLSNQPSLRFVLNWETDANDVDFHIYDGQGGHAYYSQRKLPSGGELYDDVTTGYGPECFAITGSTIAYPYAIQIHYYSRGPMGYGMGQVEIMEHDGKGGLKFEARPFVVMNDGAYLALGPVNGPL